MYHENLIIIIVNDVKHLYLLNEYGGVKNEKD
ncbi:hypothetical protein CNEO4_790003 [Clostridium neonatale]|nr:hypothetical protein CNEO4_790003 [Clostridium neonatale]